jgi:LmbE family N-acetylglucosaminyl deacetylase
MIKKNLFISVHPDDETLGCGGAILKQNELGSENNWLIITAPTMDHPYGFTSDMIKQRESEVDRVSKLLSFNKTIQLGFPTQLLDEINFRDLVMNIDQVINEIQPHVIYFINRSDIHSDHRIAFQAIYSCTKNFRKPFIEELLIYEMLSETEFAPALGEAVFMPNVFVDITDYMQKKLDIMSIYDSEVMPDNMPRSLSAISALAAYRGSRIGVKYAEAFMMIFQKR